MKKILSIAIITICMFGFGLNVFAEDASATCITDEKKSSFSPQYDSLKSQYDGGGKKYTLTKNTLIEIYGRTDSSGNITYAGNKSNLNSAIANVVTCSGGENYLKYSQYGYGSKDCKTGGYWTDVYSVTCTNNSTSTDNSTVIDKSTGNVVSGGNNSSGSGSSSTGSGSGTSSGSGTGSSSSSGSGYNSSSTVNNESTGINTYFVVLGLVGVISYIFMMCVKKYNLFKNI